MNPEIKAQWVTALRSGEYKQGRGNLRWISAKGSTYCCLGVLSDLAVKAGIACWSEGISSGEIIAGDHHDACIPVPAVCEWAGLDQGNSNDKPIGHLIGMNDGMTDSEGKHKRYNFIEIADWIEENL